MQVPVALLRSVKLRIRAGGSGGVHASDRRMGFKVCFSGVALGGFRGRSASAEPPWVPSGVLDRGFGKAGPP